MVQKDQKEAGKRNARKQHNKMKLRKIRTAYFQLPHTDVKRDPE